MIITYLQHDGREESKTFRHLPDLTGRRVLSVTFTEADKASRETMLHPNYNAWRDNILLPHLVGGQGAPAKPARPPVDWNGMLGYAAIFGVLGSGMFAGNPVYALRAGVLFAIAGALTAHNSYRLHVGRFNG